MLQQSCAKMRLSLQYYYSLCRLHQLSRTIHIYGVSSWSLNWADS